MLPSGVFRCHLGQPLCDLYRLHLFATSPGYPSPLWPFSMTPLCDQNNSLPKEGTDKGGGGAGRREVGTQREINVCVCVWEAPRGTMIRFPMECSKPATV